MFFQYRFLNLFMFRDAYVLRTYYVFRSDLKLQHCTFLTSLELDALIFLGVIFTRTLLWIKVSVSSEIEINKNILLPQIVFILK